MHLNSNNRSVRAFNLLHLLHPSQLVLSSSLNLVAKQALYERLMSVCAAHVLVVTAFEAFRFGLPATNVRIPINILKHVGAASRT